MTTLNNDEKIAVDEYRLIFDLWKSENPIKTTKLQVLIATNAILVSAFILTGSQSIWIALAGFAFSMVWVFSIGRTISYQEHWQSLLEKMRKRFVNIHMFQIHNVKIRPAVWGRVPSKYYLVGTPIMTAICWLLVFVVNVL